MTEQKKLNEFMGLTKEEAKKAQEKHGKNQLIPEKKKTFF
ncbi:cation transporter/ATPase, family protein [Clostridium botulinum 202F]|nr:cation transporter/ATPase, family protein [Clostridium botulinum 202F]